MNKTAELIKQLPIAVQRGMFGDVLKKQAVWKPWQTAAAGAGAGGLAGLASQYAFGDEDSSLSDYAMASLMGAVPGGALGYGVGKYMQPGAKAPVKTKPKAQAKAQERDFGTGRGDASAKELAKAKPKAQAKAQERDFGTGRGDASAKELAKAQAAGKTGRLALKQIQTQIASGYEAKRKARDKRLAVLQQVREQERAQGRMDVLTGIEDEYNFSGRDAVPGERGAGRGDAATRELAKSQVEARRLDELRRLAMVKDPKALSILGAFNTEVDAREQAIWNAKLDAAVKARADAEARKSPITRGVDWLTGKMGWE